MFEYVILFLPSAGQVIMIGNPRSLQFVQNHTLAKLYSTETVTIVSSWEGVTRSTNSGRARVTR